MRLFVKTYLALAILISSFSALKAQTVNLLTLDQLEARLSHGQDTTYIINLWATWCAPCLKELPHFERLGSELQEQKVKVILLSVDLPSKLKSAVRPLVARMNLINEVFQLNEKDQSGYLERLDKNWSGALPSTIFINKAKGKREFYEKEFSYAELLKSYNLI